MSDVAPGWYSDPTNPLQERLWDGSEWVEKVRPKIPVQPPAHATRSQTPWTQQRVVVALIATAITAVVLHIATTARSVGLALTSGFMPLAALVAYLAWSALNRPRPTRRHIILGAITWVLFSPILLTSYRFLNASVSSIIGIVVGGLTVLALVGMRDKQTRILSTILTTLGAVVLTLVAVSSGRYDLLVALLGMYPLYKNLTANLAAPATTRPSAHFEGAPGVYPVESPDSDRTPASKYVAITLWAFAAGILGLFVSIGVSLRNSDPAMVGFMPMLAVLFGSPFVIGGFIAWTVYKSKRRR